MAARYGKVFTQQEPVARVATSDQRDDRNFFGSVDSKPEAR